jgi:hypothetical protein
MGLDHAGMGRKLAGQDALVDVGAVLEQAALKGGGGRAGRPIRGIVYITFIVVHNSAGVLIGAVRVALRCARP